VGKKRGVGSKPLGGEMLHTSPPKEKKGGTKSSQNGNPENLKGGKLWERKDWEKSGSRGGWVDVGGRENTIGENRGRNIRGVKSEKRV